MEWFGEAFRFITDVRGLIQLGGLLMVCGIVFVETGLFVGFFLPVAPGVTPGSGPGHLALFGYDPVAHMVGRGALSALGVGFDLAAGDVAVRLNLATLDPSGRITDRRAGRPSDEEGRRVVAKVVEAVDLKGEATFFLIHEKEHRAVLIVRGEGLGAEVADVTEPI